MSANGDPAEHVAYWDRWNSDYRSRSGHDEFMARQALVAREVAESIGRHGIKILDVGCGTGWLGASLAPFGSVIGTDLSSVAVSDGRARFPEIDIRASDFMTADLQGPFDLIVSSDSLVPMPDHQACVDRLASLQPAQGVLLLMTQNPFVWARRSAYRHHDPAVPHGTISEWPNLAGLRRLLGTHYDVSSVSTLMPGGDRGVLFWVENRYVRGGMSRLIGRDRWRSLLEHARLGRELVLVARRRHEEPPYGAQQ